MYAHSIMLNGAYYLVIAFIPDPAVVHFDSQLIKLLS